MTATNVLTAMIEKLEMRCALSEDDRRAILALPHTLASYGPKAYIVREGDLAGGICAFALSGLAFRQKLTTDGARQIVALHLPGDFLDLQHLFLRVADHSVQAVGHLEVVQLEHGALQRLIRERPMVGQALWIDSLVEASIFREWVTNVGRRNARARIAHLLCEFAVRMRVSGLTDEAGRCDLPMTQEELGDAVGLTSVHVNRTLRGLEAEGLIQRDKRRISFDDWQAISQIADFNPRYLHLDQVSRGGG
ncbi:Crp/Fnr family transcriptional regulator [Sphingomonas sp. KR1UV-12]|uniref:Crp/Fnr family transcriptional regulator n=1 Tax=Sphingomonas aurea TaxID=3063994 RepID=A0ABT9EML0_9SPHN|nr:Crp/Fnr family transcriptional regulator [Sphingomonas sp. KR1UV-12]MDP1028176.1 Crp/Fnr family transcriptional regulator [Sphingomonas sp. KR1UV-12]